MNPLPHALVLAVFLATGALRIMAETPALSKGDKFYVSVRLRFLTSDGSTSFNDEVLPKPDTHKKEYMVITRTLGPCEEPFTFRKAVKKKGLFTARDSTKALHGFVGDWHERIHATQKDCWDKVKAGGTARVELTDGPFSTRGRTYMLISRPQVEK